MCAGPDNKAQIKVAIGEKKNSEVKIDIWREGDTVRCEHTTYKDCKASTDIKSDTEEVVMELMPCPAPFTLSATGEARELWSEYLGDYSLTEE